MSENINILSSDILEHPEMCYDFEKGKPTGKFSILMNVISGAPIYLNASTSRVYYGRSAGLECLVSHVPEWMGWLIINFEGRKPTLRCLDEKWHYARVFAHKCIDESAKRSMDRIRNKRLVHILFPESAFVEEKWRKDVIKPFVVRREDGIELDHVGLRLPLGENVEHEIIEEYRYKTILGIYIAKWQGVTVIRLWNNWWGVRIKDTTKAALLFSERMGIKSWKRWHIGKWNITLLEPWNK